MPPKNKCLACKYWKKKRKVCKYDPCDECRERGLIPYTEYKDDKWKPNVCDGTCNPPDCKYGYDAMPEKWNPDYKIKD